MMQRMLPLTDWMMTYSQMTEGQKNKSFVNRGWIEMNAAVHMTLRSWISNTKKVCPQSHLWFLCVKPIKSLNGGDEEEKDVCL